MQPKPVSYYSNDIVKGKIISWKQPTFNKFSCSVLLADVSVYIS